MTALDRLYLKYLARACAEVEKYVDAAMGGGYSLYDRHEDYMTLCRELLELSPDNITTTTPVLKPFDVSDPFKCLTHAKLVGKHIAKLL